MMGSILGNSPAAAAIPAHEAKEEGCCPLFSSKYFILTYGQVEMAFLRVLLCRQLMSGKNQQKEVNFD